VIQVLVSPKVGLGVFWAFIPFVFDTWSLAKAIGSVKFELLQLIGRT
jgi:hypothetical protein